eukprot:TRINITY_DN3454_c0_g1_i1.p1 TRINITY_DN3454_c0_g1~~TRINITY_DN3454_c0_g1_i1.p1  ORF type:complete len:288 (-),score=64.07 TRINITY_DN3454_c0_g1_i1:8-871(-)
MDTIEKEDNNVFEQLSMVAHKLPQNDAPQEISELPVSMAAHTVHTYDEEDWMEKHENISMISHQITDQDIFVEPVRMNEETIEEPGIFYNPSMCTHKISYLETQAEPSEHQVSMVAHSQHTIDNEEDSLSMVCHQTSEHYVEACHEEEHDQQTDQELVEDEETDQAENFIFISSMVNHQLSDNEIIFEVSKIAVSMASHVIDTNDMEDTAETSQSISMVAHQIPFENESIVPFSINEDSDAPDPELMLKEIEILNNETQVQSTCNDFQEYEEEPQVQTTAIGNQGHV